MLLISATWSEHGKHLATVATRAVNKQRLDWELPLQSCTQHRSLNEIQSKAPPITKENSSHHLSLHDSVSSANTPSQETVWDGGFAGPDAMFSPWDQISPNPGSYANPRLKEAGE